MSSAFGPLIDHNEMLINANWKIVLENTLEVYHVDFVHQDSFKRLGTRSGPETVRFDAPHSIYTSPLSEKFDADCRLVQSLFLERPFETPGYLHMHLFPNTTIATTFGASFAFQHIEPLGPERTRFTSYVFQSTMPHAPKGAMAAMLQAFNQSVKDFNRQVFEEDRSICEGVHQGAKQARGIGILSEEETRIGEFQQHYVSAIDESGTSHQLELGLRTA